jgi:hypothetical protein
MDEGEVYMKEREEGHAHTEELREVTIGLEQDQIEALEELAAEYGERLGQGWDLGAMVRLAVGDFLTKLGRMS